MSTLSKLTSPGVLRCATVLSTLLMSLGAANVYAAGEIQPRMETASCEKPEYPTRWQDEGTTGTTMVGVLVDADGKVLASKVISSSGSARVDRASVKASARCKFQPGARDGQAAPSWTKVQYSWVVE